MRLEELKSRPIRIRGIEILEAKLVAGTIAVLILMGRYSLACCTACPASCAATPIAAAEGLL